MEERGTFENKPYHDWTSNYADAFQAMAVSLPETKQKDTYESDALAFIGRSSTDLYSANDYSEYQRSARKLM